MPSNADIKLIRDEISRAHFVNEAYRLVNEINQFKVLCAANGVASDFSKVTDWIFNALIRHQESYDALMEQEFPAEQVEA